MLCMVMLFGWYRLRSVALKKMMFAIKYYFPSTASSLGGTFKTKKANSLMNCIYNLTKLRLNKLTREKSISRHYIMVSKGIGPIFVKIVAWQICFLHGTSNRHRSIVPYAWSSCSSQKICPTPTRCKYAGWTKTKMMLLFRRSSTILVSCKHGQWTSTTARNNWLRLYLNWHCLFFIMVVS